MADHLVDRSCARLDGTCECPRGHCRRFRKTLPPDVSSDWHQIIAKALYLRWMKTGPHDIRRYGRDGEQAVFTRDELERACDAEFEYGLDGDSMVFRPVADTSIPGELPNERLRDGNS